MAASNLEVSILPLLTIAIPIVFGCLALLTRRGGGRRARDAIALWRARAHGRRSPLRS